MFKLYFRSYRAVNTLHLVCKTYSVCAREAIAVLILFIPLNILCPIIDNQLPAHTKLYTYDIPFYLVWRSTAIIREQHLKLVLFKIWWIQFFVSKLETVHSSEMSERAITARFRNPRRTILRTYSFSLSVVLILNIWCVRLLNISVNYIVREIFFYSGTRCVRQSVNRQAFW
jgi:hypothetical protein